MNESCHKCDWLPWETQVWFTTGLIAFFMLVFIAAGWNAQTDAARRQPHRQAPVPRATK